jgi:hypothetical protein
MRPFRSYIRTTLAMTIIGLGISAAEAIEDFRFGMTPIQLRSLPGSSWSALETTQDRTLAVGWMKGLRTTTIEGYEFRFEVSLRKNKAHRITFAQVRSARPVLQRSEFQELMQRLKMRCTSFSSKLKPEDVVAFIPTDPSPIGDDHLVKVSIAAGDNSCSFYLKFERE